MAESRLSANQHYIKHYKYYIKHLEYEPLNANHRHVYTIANGIYMPMVITIQVLTIIINHNV